MKKLGVLIIISILFLSVLPANSNSNIIDPFEMKKIFERFPNVQVVPLDNGNAWGVMHADVYGKIYLKRATEGGWRREWELTSLGSKIRRFFVIDLEGDGKVEIVVATAGGKIIVYEMESYNSIWENIESGFKEIKAIDIANIDKDKQFEIVVLADSHIYIFDGLNKNREWMSDREFDAENLLVDNVDRDPQYEIVLNSGIVIDAKFHNIDLEWGKSFGERIIAFDMNNDGYKDIIGEFSDYSIRIFDVTAKREVW
ncbi:MAG: hypothetical protein U5O15_03920 [Candidatus Krumholzibacteriota bacterium]|nr:hypothetical protein [Candidatus Krumholzibacteriota bacterium]